MIYLTSDLHFNHKNILKYEPISRPFNSIEEMNNALINNWNSIIHKEDTVYVLGDFAMGRDEDSKKCIEQLNGKIILIRGNHDNKSRIEMYKSLGIEIYDIQYLTYKGKFFILCHFPPVNEEFIKMVAESNKEVVWLYGHVHHNGVNENNFFHVGVDTNNLTPVSIEDIWRKTNEFVKQSN